MPRDQYVPERPMRWIDPACFSSIKAVEATKTQTSGTPPACEKNGPREPQNAEIWLFFAGSTCQSPKTQQTKRNARPIRSTWRRSSPLFSDGRVQRVRNLVFATKQNVKSRHRVVCVRHDRNPRCENRVRAIQLRWGSLNQKEFGAPSGRRGN